MKTGEIYEIQEESFWYLFAEKDQVLSFLRITYSETHKGSRMCGDFNVSYVSYWRKQISDTLSEVKKNDLVVLLEQDGILKKFIAHNGKIGWTFFTPDFDRFFKKVNQYDCW